jgi:lantibiotic modifying enzyme
LRKAARAALDYEASQFSRERANWPDWRFDDSPGAPTTQEADYMVTWCHGAPGMGLARLAMRTGLSDMRTRTELRTAVATTLAQGFGRSHSLCHGDAGNLELLAEASRQLADPALGEHVRRGATTLLAEIDARGWRCGVPTGVEAPGLMMGLSGIGYGLLRLARPQLIPSVLTLSAEPATAALPTLVAEQAA